MSAVAWKRGVSDREQREIQVCLNCPLPECNERRTVACPIFDYKIVLNEFLLELNKQAKRRRGTSD